MKNLSRELIINYMAKHGTIFGNDQLLSFFEYCDETVGENPDKISHNAYNCLLAEYKDRIVCFDATGYYEEEFYPIITPETFWKAYSETI